MARTESKVILPVGILHNIIVLLLILKISLNMALVSVSPYCVSIVCDRPINDDLLTHNVSHTTSFSQHVGVVHNCQHFLNSTESTNS